MRICISIETKDRRLNGGVNYLGQTLRNMWETGVFHSDHLHRLVISGGGELPDFFDTEIAPNIPIHVDRRPVHFLWQPCPPEGVTRQQNGARAIRAAGETYGADWVMKLEDDLDFCGSFLESTANWLADYGHLKVPMFCLAATYQIVSQSKYTELSESVMGPGTSFPHVRDALARGERVATHPFRGFWGAQALVWKREMAEHLANWLGPDPYLFDGKEKHRNRGHDLILNLWGASVKADKLAVALPAFVQHIGRQSNLSQPGNPQPFFEFPWPGRDWVYDRRTDGKA